MRILLLSVLLVVISFLMYCSESIQAIDGDTGEEGPPGDLIILTSEHVGWGRGDCFHCHPSGKLSSTHDGITDETVCQGCHGQNGTNSGIGLCATCHGYPPSSGAHNRHADVIPEASGCVSCHNTSGATSPNHRNSVVDVVLDPVYGGSWNGMSCSSVSCHGCGIPKWYEDTQLDCSDCHSITCGAANDIASGQHNKHLGRFDYSCDICHTAAPSTHYNGIMDNPDNIQPDGGFYTDLTPDGYSKYGLSGTCSGMVSPCHSGTSEWITGDVCGSCHGATNANPPSSCAHPMHADAILLGYACSTCHLGVENGNTARHIDGNKDVIFDTSSLAGNNNPIFDGMTCFNIYCHGAGIPSLTGGSSTTPQWCNPASVFCGTCHGASAAQPPMSGNHDEHAGSGGQAYECAICHNITSAQHVNGLLDVVFDPGIRGWNSDAYLDGNTCRNVYCHGEGNPPLSGGADTTPEWGDSSTTFCGSCHSTPPTSGEHQNPVHSGSCTNCHYNAGSGTPRHVNGNRDVIFDPGFLPDAYISSGKCYNIVCHFVPPVDGRDWY